MKKKGFLPIYFGIMIVGTLGLGFLVFNGYRGFAESSASYIEKENIVERLEEGKIFPSETHLEEKKTRVKNYAEAVSELQNKVSEGQRELKTNYTEQDFRQFMREESEAVAVLATEKKLTLPEDFAFGLDSYNRGKAVLPGAVSRLEWELAAIKQFVHIAADSGIDSIDEFIRDEFLLETEASPSAAEKAKPTPRNKSRTSKRSGRGKSVKKVAVYDNPMDGAGKVMETYRFSAQVSASYESLTDFLNRLASDKTFFLWLRQLRIENESQKSPSIGDAPGPVPVPNSVPDADGKTPMIDATVLFGNEKMRVKLIIDAVRFKDANSLAENGAEEKES